FDFTIGAGGGIWVSDQGRDGSPARGVWLVGFGSWGLARGVWLVGFGSGGLAGGPGWWAWLRGYLWTVGQGPIRLPAHLLRFGAHAPNTASAARPGPSAFPSRLPRSAHIVPAAGWAPTRPAWNSCATPLGRVAYLTFF